MVARSPSYSQRLRPRTGNHWATFPGGLKDLNTDNPEVQEAMARIFEYWIDVADFDGFRIDTA